MGTIQFLSNKLLWSQIQHHVKRARTALVAVAYFGTGGAKLLPLRKGHTLVVDLSIAAVRQGVTNPSEIQTLIKRGVRVFTRDTLHSKFFVFDNVLIVGSTNVSKNSKERLDEAGLLSTDRAVVRRARAFLEDQLCIEPVRPEYLKHCIAEYRPPKFKAAVFKGETRRQARADEVKLWFIGGLRFIDLPDSEKPQIEAAEQKASKLMHSDSTSLGWIRYPQTTRFLESVRKGDWIIQSVSRDSEPPKIQPPSQVLCVERYKNSKKQTIHLLIHEEPLSGQEMTFPRFRRKVRSIVPKLDTDHPRSCPITNNVHADVMLSWWTASGRLSRFTKRK